MDKDRLRAAATAQLCGRAEVVREIPPPVSSGDSDDLFLAWLRRVTPSYTWTWRHLEEIQQRLERVTHGDCRRLMLSLPPRHGKSQQVTVRYPVWRLEREPSLRVIIAAYNQSLAEKFSRQARRIAEGRFALASDRAAAGEWETAAGGGVRAVGVGAGVTGHGGQLILIDDPIKSREEAESEVYRDRVWDWFRDDLYTRLEPGGAMILIMTRWHEDDLAGRIIGEMDGGGEQWERLNLPAEAEEGDPLDRAPGEALCPERFGLEDLARIRTVLGPYSYSALYQGRPVPREGSFFKWAWFNPPVAAPPAEVKLRVRYWDTAGTEGAGDYTAGVRMSLTPEGLFVIEEVTRGQWSPARRDSEIRATAERDPKGTLIWLEQESGVAGKERSAATMRALAGFNCHAEGVTGDKANRADPLAAQAEAGNVRMVVGTWNHAFLSELCGFPAGAHDDQVDAASGAFNKIAPGPTWATDPVFLAKLRGETAPAAP